MKVTVNITKFISSLKFINACPNLYIIANNAKLTIATSAAIDTEILSLYFNSLIVNLDSKFPCSYNAYLCRNISLAKMLNGVKTANCILRLKFLLGLHYAYYLGGDLSSVGDKTYPATVPNNAASVSVLKSVNKANKTKDGMNRTIPKAFNELGPKPCLFSFSV